MLNFRWSEKCFRWYRAIAAMILLVAAMIKAWQFPGIIRGDGLLSSTTGLSLIIVIETMVATTILLTPSSFSWWLTTGTYLALAAVSGFAIWTRTSCNCFGAWFSAEVTFPIDLAMVLIGAGIGIPKQRNIHCQKPLFGALVLGGLLGASLMVIGYSRNQHAVSNNPLEFVLADGLVKKPWPLDGKLSGQLKAMESGKWLAIVARQDCEHCQKLIEEHFEDPKKRPGNRRTALFIAGADQWDFMLDEVSFSAEKNGTIEWKSEPFVASPAIFVIDDGVVVTAADGMASDKFIVEVMGAQVGTTKELGDSTRQ